MIIRESQQGLINVSVPQSVIILKEPTASVRAVSTNVVGAVMQLTRGDADKLHEVGSLEEFLVKCGSYKEGFDGYLFAKNFFDTNGGLLVIARAVKEDAVVASVSITGASVSGEVMAMDFDSVGTEGNNTVVTISTSNVAGAFNMNVRNGKQTIQYDNVSTLSTSDRYIYDLVNQDDNRFFELTMTVTNGSVPTSGTYLMTGGTNGTITGASLSDSYYIGSDTVSGRTGIKLFQESDEVVMVGSARSTDDINNELMVHVDDVTLTPRRTIISFPFGTGIDSAVTKAQAISNPRVKIVYPTVGVKNPFSRVKEDVSLVPFALALDSALSYEKSASQVGLNKNVISVEKKFKPSEIAKLTKNQINPVVNKKGRGIIYASDYTTSKNPLESQNSLQKGIDFFSISLDGLVNQYISHDIDQDFWDAVKDAADAFCQTEWDAKKIGRSNGSKPYSNKMNSDNNPQAIVQANTAIMETEISFKGHADLIKIYFSSGIDMTIRNG